MAVAVGTGVACWRSATGVGVRGNVAVALESEPHPEDRIAPTAKEQNRHSAEIETADLFTSLPPNNASDSGRIG